MTDPAVRRIVVVGAGHAGGEVVAALRAGGFDGRLTLVGAEAHVPYRRPPLSKGFLLGEVDVDDLWARPPAFYDQHGVELVTGTSVTELDVRRRRVRTLGRDLPFDIAILATGGRPRPLPGLPVGADNVHYVKTIDDVTRLSGRLSDGTRLGVIGAGFVGLEVAASARTRGARVTVLEATERLLGRVCSPGVSRQVRALHRDRGVSIHTRVHDPGLEIVDGARVSALHVGRRRVPIDELVVGIGMVPDTTLAQGAGLRVRDGVLVDPDYRTSDPTVFAIGDCARVVDGSGTDVRLESAPHAASSARRAAAAILGREPERAGPAWFWSHQFDTLLQLAGDPRVRPELWLTRGDASSGRFVTFGMLRDRVARIEAVNRAGDFASAKALIARQTKVTAADLTDEQHPLRLLARP